jgi:glutaredoxin
MLNRFVLLFLVIGFLLNTGGTTSAAIYTWVDANGVVSYQDTPPPAGVAVKVVTPDSAYRPDLKNPLRAELPASASATPAGSTAPKVEIYVTSWCGYCKKAKKFFAGRGIPFTVYDIEKDQAAALRKNKLSPGGGVPVTLINGQVLRGFSASAYASALENSR